MSNVWKCALGLFVGLGVLAGGARAQFKNGSQPTELNIPRVSQRGAVSQRLGLSDITITYHRQEEGGREIWGKNEPYGKEWRGDEKEDALRVTVKPHAAEPFEVLTYVFDDVKPDSALATLRWEKLALPFRISVGVKAVVLKNVKNELRNVGGFTWAGYDEAAQWCLDNNYNLEEALKWEETSIQNEERFENWETKSRILEAMGRKEDGAKALSTAINKAGAIQLYSYARGLQRQGNTKRAFELYPQVPKKDANHWISHLALARVSSN